MRHAARSGLAVAAALVMCGGPAQALAGAPPPTLPALDAPPADNGFAGYEAAFPAGKVHLEATVIMPTLTCDPEVEEGIVTSVRLTSEDGPLQSGVSLSSYCHFGDRLHWVWIYTDTGLHGFSEATIVDGDRLKVSQRAVGNGGDVRITLTNKTQGWTVNDDTNGPAADGAIVMQNHLNWLTEDPLILSEDTRVKRVLLSGHELGSLAPVRSALVESGEVLMKASDIRNGTDFTFRYVG